jgi:hemerythrin-like domain-containing protein
MHMSAIEILVDEHRLISRIVNVLTIMQRDLDKDGVASIDADVLTDVVDFFRVFVDENHHAKEEKGLFPMLELHSVNPEGCTLQSLRDEHQQGREFMMTLANAIREFEETDPTASSKISQALSNIVDLYKDHTWRENILLFPVSEKVLQESEVCDVTKIFGTIEKKFGADFRAKYEKLVDALQKTADGSRLP